MIAYLAFAMGKVCKGNLGIVPEIFCKNNKVFYTNVSVAKIQSQTYSRVFLLKFILLHPL